MTFGTLSAVSIVFRKYDREDGPKAKKEPEDPANML
jgi:hypothetical protein